ncbi:hypothetical protein EMIHUDRAFT_214491 [Emiliania huxleyi CCMP1516]|uniref:GH18 domain-containing protein n=2 Tax=Emiliania huxleyi TaxID=2903 RepID=A0A0D3IK44_EMIH1|nr:hypothetical protein EMIHUDRAFT_214491 [Emiliania huxleyi CCMP1516]EOD11629.1 hypothetical protein EMIHUDRAFT_214491 [Emiliania huxleyi CCMP1516]|eukprot:XP_005764058.1 hypothetical protein EMIHUDRAFT_214491 [Emiliania huxleyi CCMP1516]
MLSSLFPNILFVGRWWSSSTGLAAEWAPSVWHARFQGASQLTLGIDSPPNLFYTCGGSAVLAAHGQEEKVYSSYEMNGVLVAGLERASTYTIWCGRNSEASHGTTTITAIQLDGGSFLTVALPANPLRLEAIGDSITAGFQVLVPPGGLYPQDATKSDIFKTYERRLADAWGTWDWRVVARSGISVSLSTGGTGMMSDQLGCAEYWWADWQGSCPREQWLDGGWQADVVSINLGTNDYVFGNPAQAAFAAKYSELIGLARAANPDALIFAVVPLAYSCFGGVDSKWVTMRQGILSAVNNWSQDSKVKLVETGSPSSRWLDCASDYSDYTHPTVDGNEKFALALLQSMTDETPTGGYTGFCATTWAESNPGPAACIPCDAATAPCADGSDCWGATFCKGDVLCGDPSDSDCAIGSEQTPPTALPPPPAPLDPAAVLSGKRLVAYVPNWKECPSAEQLQHYTHALVAFAVTYPAWRPAGQDTCETDRTCTVQGVPGCGGKSLVEMVGDLQSVGVKVILSFGGASMGGVWEAKGDPGSNSCWEHCLDKVDALVSQLAAIVLASGADGIDVDYEYYLDEAKYREFLAALTSGLRTALPSPFLLTHAPMDPDLCTTSIHPGCREEYLNILAGQSEMIDFIMPQYYNGWQRPSTNFTGALQHFSALASTAFGGDASKVVFGFCVSDCTGFNTGGADALRVVQLLDAAVPANGGSFFWESSADIRGRAVCSTLDAPPRQSPVQ